MLVRHESRDILAVVHGDDLMFTAIEEDLKWVHKALERRILLKVVGTIGGDSWNLKELRVLNRSGESPTRPTLAMQNC